MLMNQNLTCWHVHFILVVCSIITRGTNSKPDSVVNRILNSVFRYKSYLNMVKKEKYKLLLTEKNSVFEWKYSNTLTDRAYRFFYFRSILFPSTVSSITVTVQYETEGYIASSFSTNVITSLIGLPLMKRNTHHFHILLWTGGSRVSSRTTYCCTALTAWLRTGKWLVKHINRSTSDERNVVNL